MNAIPCITDTPEKPIALKRKAARPHILGYLLPVVPEEGEEMVEAYMVSHSYGLEITTILLANGEKIVYNDFGGLGEAYYYNAKGHCYMSVID
jgi:hypothetical protein